VPFVSLLSFAEKKVTKKAAEIHDGSDFRGAAIKLWCYCGARLIDSDILRYVIARYEAISRNEGYGATYSNGGR